MFANGFHGQGRASRVVCQFYEIVVLMLAHGTCKALLASRCGVNTESLFVSVNDLRSL
jgi:hypothetical protein